MYKTLKDNLPDLEKRIRAIGRKLDKYGLKWSFEILGESVERVGVHRIDPATGTPYRDGEVVVDVVSYAFDMEPLKLGAWSPVAVIEHQLLINADEIRNMVHAINGGEATITGTIKAHDEYDGQKQTVLTRCKIA